MSDFDRPKNNDVYIEEGELQRVRCPRTGQIKEVDLSLPALSRTMEEIRRNAEMINQPNASFEMAMSRFESIKELVLDHAQFSPKLKNLQVRILNRTIEVVREIDEIDLLKTAYARNYYITKAKAELAKENRSSKEGRLNAINKALEIMQIAIKKYLSEDEETLKFIDDLLAEKAELGS